MKWGVVVVLLLALLGSGTSLAHQPSDSYLTLTLSEGGTGFSGSWDIHVRDLEHAVGIDRDGDGELTWGELKAREAAIAAYVLSHLEITSGDSGSDACPLVPGALLADRHVDGAYAVLPFTGSCPVPPAGLVIRYTLLFALDPDHRGLVNLVRAGGAQSGVFSATEQQLSFNLDTPSAWQQFRSFAGEGVWHILHGYDHLLFLVTLLLPAVLLYERGQWTPRTTLRGAVADVALVATMFTLAHSVTLSLAALGWVSLPGRWVESTIALTVLLAALNNLFPVVTRRRWAVAFVFGLIHGFGFAAVLADLGLQDGNLQLALIGFNVGVELGQLALILVLVPVIYPLRAHWVYRRVALPVAAITVGCLALYWFAERALKPALI